MSEENYLERAFDASSEAHSPFQGRDYEGALAWIAKRKKK